MWFVYVVCKYYKEGANLQIIVWQHCKKQQQNFHDVESTTKKKKTLHLFILSCALVQFLHLSYI
jgi:hypothetical protein